MDLSNLTLSELLDLIESHDNEALTEIMLLHKDRWNLLMQESRRISRRIRLKELVFQKKDLTGLDLSDTIIEDSDFSGSDLSHADLSQAVISRTSLEGANLFKVDMESARITQSSLSRARIYSANAGRAYLTGSVNLFMAYSDKGAADLDYKTSPKSTEKGFRAAAGYEHDLEEEEPAKYGY